MQESVATLAQPSLDGKTPKKLPSMKLEMPSLSFAIHRDLPTFAEQQFLDDVLKSDRLSWNAKVQHIVLLGSTRLSSGKIQQLATSLLEQHNGDAKEGVDYPPVGRQEHLDTRQSIEVKSAETGFVGALNDLLSVLLRSYSGICPTSSNLRATDST